MNVIELPTGARAPAAPCPRTPALLRRKIEDSKAAEAAARERLDASWEPFCVLRNRLAELAPARDRALQSLALARQRTLGRSPTGDLIADNRAAAAFRAKRDAEIASCETALSEIDTELEATRREMMRLEQQRRAQENAILEASGAGHRAERDLRIARLAGVLEADPGLAAEFAALTSAEQIELLREALELARTTIEPPPARAA